RHVDPVDLDPTGHGLEEGGHDADRGGLARPVRADESVDLAGVNVEAHVAQDLVCAVAVPEVARADDGVARVDGERVHFLPPYPTIRTSMRARSTPRPLSLSSSSPPSSSARSTGTSSGNQSFRAVTASLTAIQALVSPPEASLSFWLIANMSNS